MTVLKKAIIVISVYCLYPLAPVSAQDETERSYTYHHIGIPTTEPQPDERYSSTFKMHTSDVNDEFRIQKHRFEEGSSLHPLLRTRPHVAFKVDSIDEIIKGKTVLLEPYYPFDNFRVAIVEIEGMVIEFIETSLTEEEIWDKPHKGSVIYPESD